MMEFEEFVMEMKERVAAIMGTGYDVTARKVPKNNGLVLTGLVIERKGDRIAPAIYLDQMYGLYMDGHGRISLESMAKSVVDTCQEHGQETRQLGGSIGCMKDYREARDKIIYKLVNTGENRELLSQIPSIPFHDLSIVFMVFIEESGDGICTALIHNQHMELWDVAKEDLYTEARRNTPRLLPETCMGMDEVLKSLVMDVPASQEGHLTDNLPDTEKPPFYVLTNRLGIGGAACLLYPDVLKKYAETIGHDLLILPSSVHETLLMPCDGRIKADEIRQLVQDINASEVPPEDRLSDHVYQYRYSEDRIMIAA